MTKKICVVITARPSYSRVKTVLESINNSTKLELQIVVSSSAILNRYGDVSKYIQDDGFHINAKLHTLVEGENSITMAKTTALNLLELSTVLDTLKPDFVISIADRYETIATAIAASYMNISLIHIQGGEVTGSIDEKVRHAVTKLSDYHFVSTKLAKDRVVKMGENPGNIFITGCPSIDIADRELRLHSNHFDPIVKYGGVGNMKKHPEEYFIVMQHPVTDQVQCARNQIMQTLYAIHDSNFPTYWFWPNADAGSDEISKGIRIFREKFDPKNIHFFKNLTSSDFIQLLINSKAIIGNSSVAIRECSYLGVPCVNIGTRQSTRERGKNVIDVNHCRSEILEVLNNIIDGDFSPKSDTLYGNGNAGLKIAKILESLEPLTSKRLSY